MRSVAEAILGLAYSIGAYSSWWARRLFNIAKGVCTFDGSQPVVIIGDHSLKFTFRKRKDTEEYSNENLYENGAIYFEDYANPVRVERPKHGEHEEYNLCPSEKYGMAMRLNLLNQAYDTETETLNLMHKLMIANIGVIACVGVGILVMMQ